MPDYLSEPHVLWLVAAALVAVLVLWVVARRAPGNMTRIIGVGLLVVAIGAGAFLAQNMNAPTKTEKSAERVDDQIRAEKLREEARAREAERKLAQAREEAAQKAREEAARIREAARKRESETRARAEEAARPTSNGKGKSAAAAERRIVPPPSATDPKPRAAAPGEAPRGAGTSETAAVSEEKKWDVVPVFYGTDRESVSDVKRARYSAGRGERLEVGRALVTVPKKHEVPNIERPWVYKIPFFNIEIYKEKEDPEKHFTMREVQRLSKDQFIALARQRIADSNTFRDQALVFVHGFNTTFDYAVYRAAQLSYDLKFDGGSFVYSWPSRGEVSATGYTWDTTSSENAEDYLKEFLTLITKSTGAKSVTVIAHSMGNKLLLPVLEKLNSDPDNDVKISQVILAAPDVDRNIFTKLARKINGISQGITLYAAANDRALDVSKKFWGGGARAGDVPTGGPVVVAGVDTIDVTATSTEVFALNHAGYAEKTELLADIRHLMLKGYIAPKQRMPILEQIATPDGEYWRFPAQ